MKRLNIIGITLLNINEAKLVPQGILRIGCRWWLKNHSFSEIYEVNIDPRDYVHGIVSTVNHTDYGVRPALEIANLKQAGLKTGDVFTVGYYQYRVISEEHALCEMVVATMPVEICVTKGNDGIVSDIKFYLNDFWYTDVKPMLCNNYLLLKE